MRLSVAFAAGGSLLAITLVALLGIRHGRVESQEVAGPPPVKVALASAEKRVMPRYYSSVGTLEANQQVLVTAETAGRIVALQFDSGQALDAGQPLVTLNDAPEQAQRIRLTALLKNAENRLARIRQLLPSRATTQEQFDQAQADRDAARGALEQVNAAIAQKNVRAPFGGQAGIRLVHLGQYLNPGDPIASLSDNRHLRANFSLDERARAELAPGQAVELQFQAAPGRTFTARVSAIDPILDSARMTRVQATLEDSDPLLSPGMYANVRVRRPDDAPVLSVPRTAVVTTAYGDTAFVAREGEHGLVAERVTVRIGATQDERVEILGGLQPGDRVVLSGQIRLSDGTPLQATDRNTLEHLSLERSSPDQASLDQDLRP